MSGIAKYICVKAGAGLGQGVLNDRLLTISSFLENACWQAAHTTTLKLWAPRTAWSHTEMVYRGITSMKWLKCHVLKSFHAPNVAVGSGGGLKLMRKNALWNERQRLAWERKTTFMNVVTFPKSPFSVKSSDTMWRGLNDWIMALGAHVTTLTHLYYVGYCKFWRRLVEYWNIDRYSVDNEAQR